MHCKVSRQSLLAALDDGWRQLATGHGDALGGTGTTGSALITAQVDIGCKD